ncbi:hypothetical protein EBT31_18275 [bacterium]|jgi:hypothetical protein|nr:hypothetical protein [bacterium]NBX51331.1 hypothetical protein [bacterium]
MAPSSPAFSPPISDDEDVDLDDLLKKNALLSIRIRKKFNVLKQDSDSKYFTYALLLQNGFVYVGNSDNIYVRLMEHFEQSPLSSQFVRHHGPVVRVLEIIRNSSRDDELYKTLEWCDLMGWQKVRGASYCKVEMNHPPPPLATFKRDPTRTFEYMTRDEIEDVERVAKRLAKKLFS